MTVGKDVSMPELGTKVITRISGQPQAGQVLCLHALGLDRFEFDGIRRYASPAWQLRSHDLRGHGALRAEHGFTLDDLVDDACRAIDGMQGRVHLIGHAFGSVVAALACARQPRVRSLTLLTPPTIGIPAFAERAAEAERDGVDKMVGATLQRWFGSNTPAGEPGLAYARAALQSMSAIAYASGWRALASFKGYAGLAEQLPPTLCLAAADDLSTPAYGMQGIVNAFSEAGRAASLNFKVHARGGHMLPLCEPSWVTDLAERHWAANGSSA